MSEWKRFLKLFLFFWQRFNSDLFTKNCRLNSDSTVGPTITYKLFQTRFISVIFQIQLNSDSLLYCIDPAHLDSILVNWIRMDWWIRIELCRSDVHTICKDLSSSPTYDQWSFSPVIRFLLSPIEPKYQHLWWNIKNMLSVMIFPHPK